MIWTHLNHGIDKKNKVTFGICLIFIKSIQMLKNLFGKLKSEKSSTLKKEGLKT